jgi:fructose-bisphosphate aldolase class II
MTLRDCIAEAEKKGVAIGHFNISDSEGFKAVVEGLKEASAHASFNIPVIIGVSEGEREFIGLREIVSLVEVARGNGMEIYLNADHTYSVEKAKTALDAGVDSVIIDASDKTFEENVSLAKEVVQYANGKALVEGELGFIGKSSKVLEEMPEGVTQTNPDDARRFIEETRVDLLAPSVGNIHGVVKSGEPKLNIELIRNIRKAVKVPLVLHGASGNSDEDIRASIKAGISVIHINTELRLAYKAGLEEAVKSGEIAPYKFMQEAVNDMKEVVVRKLKLFNNL